MSYALTMPRPLRLLLAGFYRWTLDCNESWIHELQSEGYGSQPYFDRCRKQAEADRVRIALLEA